MQMDNCFVNQGYPTEQRPDFCLRMYFAPSSDCSKVIITRYATHLRRQLTSAIEAKKAVHSLKMYKGVAYYYTYITVKKIHNLLNEYFSVI